MKVKDSMTRQVICVGAQEPVEAAARLMARYNLGMLPVKSAAGRLLGVVTDRDLAVRALTGKKQVTVGQVMSRPAHFAEPENSLEEAAGKMAAWQVRRLPVVQDGSLVGVISLGDLAGLHQTQAGACLGKICGSVCRLGETEEKREFF